MAKQWAINIEDNDEVFDAVTILLKDKAKIKKGTKITLKNGKEVILKHSFIRIMKEQASLDEQTNQIVYKEVPVAYAVANRKIHEVLGEGHYGRVKLAQDKRGINYANKIEGRGRRGNRDAELRIMKAIGYVEGEESRKVEEQDFKGKVTDEKLNTMMQLKEGKEFYRELYTNALKPGQLYKPGSPKRKSNLDETQKLIIAIKCCQAIQDLHNRGVIHGDIKPANFIANIQGKHIVMAAIDFGFSFMFERDSNGSLIKDEQGKLIIKHAGIPLGTDTAYMPDEVTKGALSEGNTTLAEFSFASDIYSLGVMLRDDLQLPDEIVQQMTAASPDGRPVLSDVIRKLSTRLEHNQDPEAQKLYQEIHHGVRQMKEKDGPQIKKASLIAQMMSGYRDPIESIGDKKSTLYTSDDFHIIATQLYSKIPPVDIVEIKRKDGTKEEIKAKSGVYTQNEIDDFKADSANERVTFKKGFFTHLIEAYQELNDDEDKKIFLQNAEILIKELIKVDVNQNFITETKNGIERFYQEGPGKENPLISKMRSSLNVEISNSNLRKAAISRDFSNPPVDGEINIVNYIHQTLASRKIGVGDKYDMRKHAKTLASDLMKGELTALKQLNITNFHNQGYLKKDNSFQVVEDYCAQLKGMIITDILSAKNKEHQKRIFALYVRTAESCIEMGNYASALTILGTLTDARIEKFEYLLSEQPKTAKRLSEAKSLLGPELKFKKLKQHMEKMIDDKKQIVPPLGTLISADFYAAEDLAEVNKNGKTNEDKLQYLGKPLDIIVSSQLQAIDNTQIARTNVISRLRVQPSEDTAYKYFRDAVDKVNQTDKSKSPVYSPELFDVIKFADKLDPLVKEYIEIIKKEAPEASDMQRKKNITDELHIYSEDKTEYVQSVAKNVQKSIKKIDIVAAARDSHKILQQKLSEFGNNSNNDDFNELQSLFVSHKKLIDDVDTIASDRNEDKYLKDFAKLSIEAYKKLLIEASKKYSDFLLKDVELFKTQYFDLSVNRINLDEANIKSTESKMIAMENGLKFITSNSDVKEQLDLAKKTLETITKIKLVHEAEIKFTQAKKENNEENKNKYAKEIWVHMESSDPQVSSAAKSVLDRDDSLFLSKKYEDYKKEEQEKIDRPAEVVVSKTQVAHPSRSEVNVTVPVSEADSTTGRKKTKKESSVLQSVRSKLPKFGRKRKASETTTSVADTSAIASRPPVSVTAPANLATQASVPSPELEFAEWMKSQIKNQELNGRKLNQIFENALKDVSLDEIRDLDPPALLKKLGELPQTPELLVARGIALHAEGRPNPNEIYLILNIIKAKKMRDSNDPDLEKQLNYIKLVHFEESDNLFDDTAEKGKWYLNRGETVIQTMKILNQPEFKEKVSDETFSLMLNGAYYNLDEQDFGTNDLQTGLNAALYSPEKIIKTMLSQGGYKPSEEQSNRLKESLKSLTSDYAKYKASIQPTQTVIPQTSVPSSTVSPTIEQGAVEINLIYMVARELNKQAPNVITAEEQRIKADNSIQKPEKQKYAEIFKQMKLIAELVNDEENIIQKLDEHIKSLDLRKKQITDKEEKSSKDSKALDDIQFEKLYVVSLKSKFSKIKKDLEVSMLQEAQVKVANESKREASQTPISSSLPVNEEPKVNRLRRDARPQPEKAQAAIAKSTTETKQLNEDIDKLIKKVNETNKNIENIKKLLDESADIFIKFPVNSRDEIPTVEDLIGAEGKDNAKKLVQALNKLYSTNAISLEEFKKLKDELSNDIESHKLLQDSSDTQALKDSFAAKIQIKQIAIQKIDKSIKQMEFVSTFKQKYAEAKEANNLAELNNLENQLRDCVCVTNKDFRRNVVALMVENGILGKPEDSIIKQLLSGYKDPTIFKDSLVEKISEKYTEQEFKNIAKYLLAATSAETVLENLSAMYFDPNQTPQSRIEILKNASTLIPQLMLADEGQEKFPDFSSSDNKNEEAKRVRDSFNTFIERATSESISNPELPNLITSFEDKCLKTSKVVKENTVKRDASIVKLKSQPAETDVISINDFLKSSLAEPLKSKKEGVQRQDDIKKNAKIMADDLRKRGMALFLDIEPSDLYNQAWANNKIKEKLNIIKAIRDFNLVSQSVKLDILNTKEISHQQDILRFYIEVVKNAMESGDYNTVYMIGSAFNSSTIRNLKHLDNLPEFKAMLADKTFVEITNREKNHKSYHELVKKNKDTLNIIPFMGIYLSQLTFADDGNPSTRTDPIDETRPKQLNADKIDMLGGILSTLYDSKAKLESEAAQAEPLKSDLTSRLEFTLLSEDKINQMADNYRLSQTKLIDLKSDNFLALLKERFPSGNIPTILEFKIGDKIVTNEDALNKFIVKLISSSDSLKLDDKEYIHRIITSITRWTEERDIKQKFSSKLDILLEKVKYTATDQQDIPKLFTIQSILTEYAHSGRTARMQMKNSLIDIVGDRSINNKMFSSQAKQVLIEITKMDRIYSYMSDNDVLTTEFEQWRKLNQDPLKNEYIEWAGENKDRSLEEFEFSKFIATLPIERKLELAAQIFDMKSLCNDPAEQVSQFALALDLNEASIKHDIILSTILEDLKTLNTEQLLKNYKELNDQKVSIIDDVEKRASFEELDRKTTLMLNAISLIIKDPKLDKKLKSELESLSGLMLNLNKPSDILKRIYGITADTNTTLDNISEQIQSYTLFVKNNKIIEKLQSGNNLTQAEFDALNRLGSDTDYSNLELWSKDNAIYKEKASQELQKIKTSYDDFIAVRKLIIENYEQKLKSESDKKDNQNSDNLIEINRILSDLEKVKPETKTVPKISPKGFSDLPQPVPVPSNEMEPSVILDDLTKFIQDLDEIIDDYYLEIQKLVDEGVNLESLPVNSPISKTLFEMEMQIKTRELIANKLRHRVRIDLKDDGVLGLIEVTKDAKEKYPNLADALENEYTILSFQINNKIYRDANDVYERTFTKMIGFERITALKNADLTSIRRGSITKDRSELIAVLNQQVPKIKENRLNNSLNKKEINLRNLDMIFENEINPRIKRYQDFTPTSFHGRDTNDEALLASIKKLIGKVVDLSNDTDPDIAAKAKSVLVKINSRFEGVTDERTLRLKEEVASVIHSPSVLKNQEIMKIISKALDKRAAMRNVDVNTDAKYKTLTAIYLECKNQTQKNPHLVVDFNSVMQDVMNNHKEADRAGFQKIVSLKTKALLKRKITKKGLSATSKFGEMVEKISDISGVSYKKPDVNAASLFDELNLLVKYSDATFDAKTLGITEVINKLKQEKLKPYQPSMADSPNVKVGQLIDAFYPYKKVGNRDQLAIDAIKVYLDSDEGKNSDIAKIANAIQIINQLRTCYDNILKAKSMDDNDPELKKFSIFNAFVSYRSAEEQFKKSIEGLNITDPDLQAMCQRFENIQKQEFAKTSDEFQSYFEEKLTEDLAIKKVQDKYNKQVAGIKKALDILKQSNDKIIDFSLANYDVKGPYTEREAKAILLEVSNFIKTEPAQARLHKEDILKIVNDYAINAAVKKDKKAIDVRALFYDVPNNDASTKALAEHSKLKSKDASIKYQIFNLPDTNLSLSAGPDEESQKSFLEAAVNNSVPVRHILAIGRDDFHYAIVSEEASKDNIPDPKRFTEPDFSPYFEKGKIVNKVGRILTYQMDVDGKEIFVHQFALKNKGVADLTDEERAYVESLWNDSHDSNAKILVHCKGGTGRTGAMISALLGKEPIYQNMSYDEALEVYSQIRSQAGMGAATEEGSQRNDAKNAFGKYREGGHDRPFTLPDASNQEFIQKLDKNLRQIQAQRDKIQQNNPGLAKFSENATATVHLAKLIELYKSSKMDEIQQYLTENFDKVTKDNSKISFTIRNDVVINLDLKDIVQLSLLSEQFERVIKCENVDQLNDIEKQNETELAAFMVPSPTAKPSSLFSSIPPFTPPVHLLPLNSASPIVRPTQTQQSVPSSPGTSHRLRPIGVVFEAKKGQPNAQTLLDHFTMHLPPEAPGRDSVISKLKQYVDANNAQLPELTLVHMSSMLHTDYIEDKNANSALKASVEHALAQPFWDNKKLDEFLDSVYTPTKPISRQEKSSVNNNIELAVETMIDNLSEGNPLKNYESAINTICKEICESNNVLKVDQVKTQIMGCMSSINNLEKPLSSENVKSVLDSFASPRNPNDPRGKGKPDYGHEISKTAAWKTFTEKLSTSLEEKARVKHGRNIS